MIDPRTLGRKFNKLRTKPRLFLADAQNPAFRLLHGIVEAAWPEVKPLGTGTGRQAGPVRPASPKPVAPAPISKKPGASPRQVVEQSGLFDAKFYLSEYEDLRRKGVKDPLDHYLKHGSSELRRPNDLFDPPYYAARAGIKPSDAPLLHYIREGEAKGLQPSRGFDPTYYLTQNPDVVAARMGALAHYLRFGRSESRRPCASTPQSAVRLEHDLRETAVTILVPVFNNAQHVQRCIESVLAYTRMPRAELLLIDDASDDLETRLMLERYGRKPGITLLRNDSNLGFTKTVNRGLRQASQRDVVLLNSDTVVGPRWLERLALVAYSEKSVATATALSDNAGAFSTPKVPNNSLDFMSVQDAARLSARAATDEAHFVPTGNGFCMYMRRDAIDDVGLLDDVNFPRGYGEENDWCMRAGERGWRHATALRSYVHHVNAVSFGSEAKQALRESARQVLDRLHPDYGLQVKRAFGGENALATQREVMADSVDQVRRNLARPPRARVLFVVSTQSGGTPLTNEDLMRGVSHVYEPLLLVCDSREIKLFHVAGGAMVELANHRLTESVRLVPHTSHEYDRVLATWLLRYDIELVHVRHIAWHSLGLIKTARRQCIPVVFSFHDFYTVCPSVNLTNGKDAWCEQGVTTPHISAPLWTKRDPEGVTAAQAMDAPAFLQMWKRRMNAALAECDAFVTTAPVVKSILTKNLPTLREREVDFNVIPHGRDFPRFLPPRSAPRSDAPLRVLLAGNISETKGLATVLALLELDTDGLIELHTLGEIAPALATARGKHHGPYQREDFLERIATIVPDIGLIPTICPETFCHTLTECWAAGLPVVGSDLGALGERLRESGAGWTIDPRDPMGLLQLLCRIRSGEEDWSARADAVARWQSTASESSVSAMASRYIELYQSVLQGGRPLLPALGRRGADLKQRIAVVAKGHFPVTLPTAFVRLATPLGQASHELIDYEWIAATELVRIGVRDFDGVLVCRNAGEPAALSELARQCRTHNVPLVLDMDDDLLNVPADKDRTGDYARARPALNELLATASLTITSTQPLADAYAGLTRAVRIVPNRLDPNLWAGPIEPLAEKPKPLELKATLRVLYMGSPTHQEDLELILGAFNRLRYRYGVQLYTIGVASTLPKGVTALAAPQSRYDRFIPWFRSIAKYFDVGVAPLVDTPFNRSKSDLKFLEYAACGLAVATSRVVPYTLTVRHGEDGLLVENDEDSWFNAIESLLLRPDLRTQLAEAARARAEREFMTTSCVFDELPWREWRGAGKRSVIVESDKHHPRHEAEASTGVW